MSRFTSGDRLQVAVLLLCMAPFAATVFFGVASGDPAVVVVATGLAIASAGFSLAWGTESLQFLVSQALALAVLAVVNVLPEYSVEVVLAYRGATDPTLLHYATAAMTGANRLLLGLGWPAVYALSAFANRRSGVRAGDLLLEKLQSVEILFLGLASVYTFVIVLRGSLGAVDAVVLLLIFAAYVYIAKKLPARDEALTAELEGPALAVAGLKGRTRALAMGFFIAVGAVAIAFGSQPFVSSFLALSSSLNLGQGAEYLLIQWVTPVLTELPEAVTVFYWAAKTGKGPLALASLISSKLNQWTLLVATIPIVYSVALGGFSTIALTPLQTSEILLTASQSLYGFVCLVDLRLTKYDVGALFTLFMVQFVVPGLRFEVSVLYLVLSAVELFRVRNHLEVISGVSSAFREHVH